MIKIKSLLINDFRHMKNVSIEFGDAITIISGLNGTGKSTILGLVGHLFSFRENKGKRFKYNTINNKPFETEYSEIFRFCDKWDYDKEYNYIAKIDNNGVIIEKDAKSRYLAENNRFRIDIGKREAEKGKLNVPVIYLGLKRLFPLAQELKIDIVENLSDDLQKYFVKEANKIFVSLEKTNSSEHVKTHHKDYISIKTEKYGVNGNSAGQDNIGQILTAILSFKRLFNELGKKDGGILLIDELDTTLFGGAQINLLKQLYGYAKEYNLQIIFTTHSLELISFLYSSDYAKQDFKINFLEIKDGAVENKIDPPIDYVKHRILLEAKEELNIPKYFLLCEDDLAKKWCQNLLKDIKKDYPFQVFATNLSDGGLIKLAEQNLACFKDYIFVVDGDAKPKFAKKKIKNVIFLPGKRPETIFYNYLKSLPESDSFWGKNFFYKDTCFNSFVDSDAFAQKKWFKQNEKHFGKNCINLFNAWKKSNNKLLIQFQQDFNKIIE